MSEENIYAPPTADIDAAFSTKYLQLDGYSEDCMLLCNKYFKSPKICIKTGEDLRKMEPSPEPKKLTVGRYMPRIRDSFLVQGAWLIRFVFLALAVFAVSISMEKMPPGAVISPIFGILIFLYFIHQLLNFCSAETVKIPLYLSASFAKQRRRHFNFWLILLAISAISIAAATTTTTTNAFPPLLVFLSVLGVCLSLAVIMYTTPLFKMKFRRGDYYYVSGVHPHFLAALPLRK